jgi:hypothetical protein
MENRKSKRSVRMALVLSAAVAGSALIGWGGLAAWQAYTQNNGNAFSVASLSHTNVANGGVTCNSTNSSATAASTPCSVIVSGSSLTSGWTGSTGTVVITDTGALPSTFSVSTPSAPTGSLCPALNLTITGADSVTPYVSQTGIAAISATPLNTSTGSTAWSSTNSNTFTFHVTPESGFGTDNSVPGESCNFNVLFTQSA